MFRRSLIVAVLLIPAPAFAQQPVQFKWVANQTLTYKVVQNTAVRETLLDQKTQKPVTTEARTALTLTKQWAVKAVDANGVGTLQLAITAMRNEFSRPDGSSVVIDSANPDDAKTMANFLNVPVVTIKVDSRGNLLDVKEERAGSASRLQAELPFRMTLPANGPATGQSWDRVFMFTLDPPLGTGEKYEFTQKYTCGAARDGLLPVTVATSLKNPPKTLAEQVPLVPMLWEGEVYFNPAAGRYHAARLRVKAELPNHQGEGTKFEYESTYAEDAVAK